tara:strand:- start:132 stop:419 length:288 start_codon:yes stop_codon:yes gene_type:complete
MPVKKKPAQQRGQFSLQQRALEKTQKTAAERKALAKAKEARAKARAKKKVPTTVTGKINDQGLIGKMLTPRTTLMRAILGKKKPATKKKPVKKAK